MKALVTGCAGFVGSTLSDTLLADGHTVRGIDSFTTYYDEGRKRSNIAAAEQHEAFEMVEGNLLTADLAQVLDGVDVVFHQAGQPGVRLSWSSGFEGYNNLNVLVTQRLLEAAKTAGVERFVYASSSSVYGQAERYPTTEEDLPAPFSPYGVTKLAAEHLCNLYAANWGVPTISLRYFTVYGPRQRPDMAFHRLVSAALTGDAFPLYGTGEQIRDFTFVNDVVAANIAAATADTAPGTVVNIAGGGSTSMNEVFAAVEAAAGQPLNFDRQDPQPGDVDRTGGSIEQAGRLLGWAPKTSLTDGLAAHVEWMHGELARIGRTPAAS